MITPRGALKHSFAPFPKGHESTQNQPDVSLCPDTCPSDQHLPQLRECLGSTAHYLDFSQEAQFWVLDLHSRLSLFQDPQGKQTKRLRGERAKPEQPNAHVQERWESRKEPKQTPRPGTDGESLVPSFILTLKNRKVGTELISYFSDTSGTASASNLKEKNSSLIIKRSFFTTSYANQLTFFSPRVHKSLRHISI